MNVQHEPIATFGDVYGSDSSPSWNQEYATGSGATTTGAAASQTQGRLAQINLLPMLDRVNPVLLGAGAAVVGLIGLKWLSEFGHSAEAQHEIKVGWLNWVKTGVMAGSFIAITKPILNRYRFGAFTDFWNNA